MARSILGTRKNPTLLGAFVTIVILLLTLANNQGWLDQFKTSVVVNQPGLYTVTKFVDGDTVAVNMNGKEERIRLIGVDTPETHKPNTPVQCYGPAAAAYTKAVLGTNKFRLESDGLSTNRDRYDRLLRYIILTDGSNFNQKLIESGHGFYYPYFPFTKSDAFAASQTTAMNSKAGLWGNCIPVKNDRGGYTTS